MNREGRAAFALATKLLHPRPKGPSHFCRLSLRESSAVVRHFRGAKGDDELSVFRASHAGEAKVSRFAVLGKQKMPFFEKKGHSLKSQPDGSRRINYQRLML